MVGGLLRLDERVHLVHPWRVPVAPYGSTRSGTGTAWSERARLVAAGEKLQPSETGRESAGASNERLDLQRALALPAERANASAPSRDPARSDLRLVMSLAASLPQQWSLPRVSPVRGADPAPVAGRPGRVTQPYPVRAEAAWTQLQV